MNKYLIIKKQWFSDFIVSDIRECFLEEAFLEMQEIISALDLSRGANFLGEDDLCSFNFFGRMEGGKVVQYEIDNEWLSFGGSDYHEVKIYEKTRYQDEKAKFLSRLFQDRRQSNTGRFSYTTEQRIFILDAAKTSGKSADEIAMEFGVAVQTLYRWDKQLRDRTLAIDHFPPFLDIDVPYRNQLET